MGQLFSNMENILAANDKICKYIAKLRTLNNKVVLYMHVYETLVARLVAAVECITFARQTIAVYRNSLYVHTLN